MTIYAEKRNGRITGTFIVEHKEDGERMKSRAKTMEEARKIEKDMKRGRWARPEPEAKQYLSLRELIIRGKLQRPKGKKADWNQKELEYVESLLGGDLDVEEITSKRLTNLALEIVERRKVKPASANRYVYALMGLLSWGRSQDLVTRAAVFTKLDEGKSGRTRWLTVEQEALIIDWLKANGHGAKAVCVQALGLTGMRSGELLSLRADQIDPQQGLITLEDQKDGSAQEGIPIDPELAVELKRLAKAQALPKQDQLLKWFKRAAEASGIPVGKRGVDGVVIHSLRHSTATRLIQQGVSPAEVQGYMRHKSWATTQRYVKITGSQKRNALETLKNAGQKVRGLLGQNEAIVPQGETMASDFCEENQRVGSLSRTRTCDHSINSPAQGDDKPKENSEL